MMPFLDLVETLCELSLVLLSRLQVQNYLYGRLFGRSLKGV
jgi:hypothetical protein